MATYRVSNSILKAIENILVSADRSMHRFMFNSITNIDKGKKAIAFKSFVNLESRLTNRYKWLDDRDFFAMTSSHRRKLLDQEPQ